MVAKAKRWADKMNKPAIPEVKMLEHGFADLQQNSKMLIPTPRLIENYLLQTLAGAAVDVKQMRKDLAAEYHADGTCPLTTGIFLRIVTEYTNEQHQNGTPTNQLIPVWRAVHPGLSFWKKLSFDPGWLVDLQKAEGIMPENPKPTARKKATRKVD